MFFCAWRPQFNLKQLLQLPPEGVTVLKGKVSWHLGTKEYKKVTQHSKPHTGGLRGDTQEGGSLCWVRSWGQGWLETQQEEALYRVSFGLGLELSRVGEISKQVQGLVGL